MKYVKSVFPTRSRKGWGQAVAFEVFRDDLPRALREIGAIFNVYTLYVYSGNQFQDDDNEDVFTFDLEVIKPGNKGAFYAEVDGEITRVVPRSSMVLVIAELKG